ERFLPEHFTFCLIETPDKEIVAFRHVEKDAVAPNDWRRAAPTRHRSFPGNVLFGGPFHRQIPFVTHAVETWTTPLRPVVGVHDGKREQHKSDYSELSFLHRFGSLQSVTADYTDVFIPFVILTGVPATTASARPPAWPRGRR